MLIDFCRVPRTMRDCLGSPPIRSTTQSAKATCLMSTAKTLGDALNEAQACLLLLMSLCDLTS